MHDRHALHDFDTEMVNHSSVSGEKAEDHGYCRCCSCGGYDHAAGSKDAVWRAFLRPAIAVLFLLVAVLAEHSGTISPAFYVPLYGVAFTIVGYDVIRDAIKTALAGDVWNEFMLISIAAIGAFLISEYPESVMVMIFYTVGEALQDRAVGKAERDISALVALRPDQARILTDEGEKLCSPADVHPGDVLIVRPGEKVALDGTLLSESASFDTAALTGESVPQTFMHGQEVAAGTVPLDRDVNIRVTRDEDHSTIAEILRVIKEARSRKAPAERFIRHFSHYYTPSVLAIALLVVVLPAIYALCVSDYVYIPTVWVMRALVFLVISCPCALVISVPLTYFAAIGSGSAKGILFKGGQYIDALARINHVMFDKTGTLTEGKFVVHQVIGFNATQLENVSAIEKKSIHPIAKAISSHHPTTLDTTIKEYSGRGVSATVRGHEYLIGTIGFMREQNISLTEQPEDTSLTTVYCAEDGRYIGHIRLKDAIKPQSHEAITRLHDMQVATTILSGDRRAVVEDVAKEIRVRQAHGELLPTDKVRIVDQARQNGERVAFVGDGLNDAPVLTISDVGMAMGGIGADITVQTADVVIHNDNPLKICQAIMLSKSTRSIIRQNVVGAIGFKLAIMILGLMDMASLWLAVFADTGVALLAVLNAMRVYRQKI